uniref:palmitoyl-CoA hydrolase n=1 Tax=Meleagris gallopavo TaxID=9103 RepID=A0A803YH20_MELGA
MRPDDANIAGNVHGGTVLKMIEEAGAIISTRHCNSGQGEPCVAALARVERTDFLSPMCIGEVANVSAEITYTSKHSVEVQVNVMSENILTGAKKVTNKATLWYVPLSLKNVNKVVEVPPIQYTHKEQEDEGRKRYEEQKLERLETKQRNGDVILPVINPEPHTVGYSQSSLIHLVGPSDCTLLGFVHGGVTMKLMDEVAGIVAARHCKTNIVTASVDAINFHEKIKKGSVITISGRMTFTSNKSMEIEVFVDADPFVDEPQERYRAVSAFFTYVSLSKEGKPLPVPQLLVSSQGWSWELTAFSWLSAIALLCCKHGSFQAACLLNTKYFPYLGFSCDALRASLSNKTSSLNYSVEKHRLEQASPSQAAGWVFVIPSG